MTTTPKQAIKTWQQRDRESAYEPAHDCMQAEIDELRMALELLTAERDAHQTDALMYRGLLDDTIKERDAALALAAERLVELDALCMLVKDAWSNYERYGAVSILEGQDLIHASTLADLNNAATGAAS